MSWRPSLLDTTEAAVSAKVATVGTVEEVDMGERDGRRKRGEEPVAKQARKWLRWRGHHTTKKCSFSIFSAG
jgi:hypothetical protein